MMALILIGNSLVVFIIQSYLFGLLCLLFVQLLVWFGYVMFISVVIYRLMVIVCLAGCGPRPPCDGDGVCTAKRPLLDCLHEKQAGLSWTVLIIGGTDGYPSDE